MVYNGITPQQQRKVVNNLTAEEIAELQQDKPQFNLSLTKQEHLRAICNHRSEDGMHDTLDVDPYDPNTFICRICGWKFTPIDTDASKEYVKNITDEFINLLQTIKILFSDFPTEAARNFFDIIELAKKTPELFEMAVKSIGKYENPNIYGFSNQGGNNAVTLLGNFMGAIGAGPIGGYQPVYGYQQQPQQPMMGANPVFNNPFGYAGANQQYGYQQPQTGYNPATQGYVYNAPQQQQQAQITPTPTTETTTTTNVQA
jgi:hypothetical protein